MLEHLFGSKTRVKLLTLFLHNPEKAYYVREITRMVGIQINAVRRELGNLVELGIINEVDAPTENTKKPGVKRKYYTMNTLFPLLNEIRVLVTKAHVMMERKLDREVSKLGEVKFAAVMGVFLGMADAPVDLFLIGDVKQPLVKQFIQALEKELGFDVNFTCFTEQEFLYRKEITDRFLYSILEAPKNVLIDELRIYDVSV